MHTKTSHFVGKKEIQLFRTYWSCHGIAETHNWSYFNLMYLTLVSVFCALMSRMMTIFYLSSRGEKKLK